MSENECDRMQEIKWGIISKIFFAGANWQIERLNAMADDKGQLSKENEEKFQEKLFSLVDTFSGIVDEVWGENCDCDDEEDDDEPFVCDECQKKLDADFKKEFQDKKDTK